MMRFLIPLAIFLVPNCVFAHPGGLNSSGCHNNRQTGSYHCHNGPPAPIAPQVTVTPAQQFTAPPPNALTITYDARLEIVQRLLKRLGYDVGNEFGIWNTKTEAAIRTFEATENLQSTGAVSDALVLALVKKLE